MRELEMHQLPVVPFLWGRLPGADEDAQQVPGTASINSKPWGWLINRQHGKAFNMSTFINLQKVVNNN